MRYRGVIITTAVVFGVVATRAGAQGFSGPYAQCDAGTTSLKDGCYKAVDLFNFVAPQLSASISAGNATLGQGSTLGGFPHWSAELRASGLAGTLPQVNQLHPAHTGQVQSDIPVKSQAIGLPTFDAAVGVFRGLQLPLTRMFGVDALVSATYIPSLDGAAIGVRATNGSYKLGYGVRVGLLDESVAWPGVSVTYMVRDLPTTDVIGTTTDQSSGATDTIGVRNLSLRTNGWRIVASKNLMVVGLTLGAGQDHYSSSGTLSVYVKDNNGCENGCSGTPFGFDQHLTRTNYFADLSFNLVVARLVGEIGRVSGGTIATYNTFQGHRADDARTYGSLGIRVGF